MPPRPLRSDLRGAVHGDWHCPTNLTRYTPCVQQVNLVKVTEGGDMPPRVKGPIQDAMLTVRLFKPELQAIRKAAKTAGKSIAEYVRQSCLERAKRIFAKQGRDHHAEP